MDTQDDLDLGTAPDDLQQGQSDATLLKQVHCCITLCHGGLPLAYRMIISTCAGND